MISVSEANFMGMILDSGEGKMKLSYLALVAAVGLTGCSNKEVAMINDRGERRYCYEVHQGSLDRVPAADQFNKCLNDAGTAGFRRAE